MAKSLPFEDRPTWQRVKDMGEAALFARAAMQNLLRFRAHLDKPNVRDEMCKQLTTALRQIEDAHGLEPTNTEAITLRDDGGEARRG